MAVPIPITMDMMGIKPNPPQEPTPVLVVSYGHAYTVVNAIPMFTWLYQLMNMVTEEDLLDMENFDDMYDDIKEEVRVIAALRCFAALCVLLRVSVDSMGTSKACVCRDRLRRRT